MFSAYYRKRFLLAIIINVGQQVSGINFFILYSTKIFNDVNPGSGQVITVMQSITNFLCSFLALYTSRNFGRKSNLIFGVLIQAFSLWFLNFAYSFQLYWLMAVPVMLFVGAFSVGLGGTLYLYCSEIVPSSGLGVAMFCQWIFTALVSKYVPILTGDVIPLFWMFNIFLVICLIVYVLIDAIGVETKGKEDHEISRDFQRKSFLLCK